MADISLQTRSLLGGYDETFGQTRIAEIEGLAIVSLAIPQGDEKKCADIVTKKYGADAPDNGRYATSKDGKTRILRTGPDQMFVVFEHDAPDAREIVHKDTKSAFWTTDQTDVWCVVEVNGPTSREALARLCQLDLHADVFGPDAVARTVMEHMGAMIMRTGDDAFVLMSARSSAKSFLHAVEVSAKNII